MYFLIKNEKKEGNDDKGCNLRPNLNVDCFDNHLLKKILCLKQVWAELASMSVAFPRN